MPYDITPLSMMMIDDYRLVFIVSIISLLYKIINACQNKIHRTVAYTFLNVCEKIHQLALKKMHTKENWFLFSASPCSSKVNSNNNSAPAARTERSLAAAAAAWPEVTSRRRLVTSSRPPRPRIHRVAPRRSASYSRCRCTHRQTHKCRLTTTGRGLCKQGLEQGWQSSRDCS